MEKTTKRQPNILLVMTDQMGGRPAHRPEAGASREGGYQDRVIPGQGSDAGAYWGLGRRRQGRLTDADTGSCHPELMRHAPEKLPFLSA